MFISYYVCFFSVHVSAGNVLYTITLCNFACPDLLSPVGEPLTSRPVWFTESHLLLMLFTYALFVHLILDIK